MAADPSQERKEQGRKELQQQAQQQTEREQMAQPGPGLAGAGRPGMDTQSALTQPGHSLRVCHSLGVAGHGGHCQGRCLDCGQTPAKSSPQQPKCPTAASLR